MDAASSPPPPSVISNLKNVVQLISERVMLSPECRKTIGQILHALLSERATDPTVLLCVLDTVKSWIETDYRATPGAPAAGLNPKDIVAYLQKLALVDRKAFPRNLLEEWDQKFLQLLYGLCADGTK